MQQQKVKTII